MIRTVVSFPSGKYLCTFSLFLSLSEFYVSRGTFFDKILQKTRKNGDFSVDFR